MATPTYDPAKHVLTIAGILITGFADGTYIEVDRLGDTYQSYSGAGGEVARIRMRDRRASVKVTLMATSVTNDLLSVVMIADEKNGNAIAPFDFTDLNGTTVLIAPNCWLKKPPQMGFSKELPTRVWDFECDDLSMFIGGDR